MTSRRNGRGKQLAAGTSGGNQRDEPIYIVEQGCTLIIMRPILGTPLFMASCEERSCTALIKTLDHAYIMHNLLNECKHPNLLKSIGFWTDPSDNNNAYIAVDSLDNALGSLEMEQLFHMEEGCICGFSDFGFKAFREIFSTIHYVNQCYEGRATSNSIPLFTMRLEPNNIFFKMVNGEARIMMGNFKMETLRDSREIIEAKHWRKIGRCLQTLFKGAHQVTAELTELANFLTQGAVTYHDLLWQTGIWDATTKMDFIREIFFHTLVEQQHDQEITPKARQLFSQNPLGLLEIMQQFSKPENAFKQRREYRDANLFDSVMFLRNKIIAHYDEEYPNFKGDKNEIGTTEESVEWFDRLHECFCKNEDERIIREASGKDKH
ncbi:hypothetical protein EJB05_27736 [Eragrostis curvula]|uniref:Uncharacterized protein n=1 Tax=Eragrostis curvula TaxID=38414 RepID=A0A5J9UNV5_9POAL|nr:hypothetical protein EJB05_27736 [Eragrostis curvula]